MRQYLGRVWPLLLSRRQMECELEYTGAHLVRPEISSELPTLTSSHRRIYYRFLKHLSIDRNKVP